MATFSVCFVLLAVIYASGLFRVEIKERHHTNSLRLGWRVWVLSLTSSAPGIFAPFTLIARMASGATELSKLSLADASELVRRKSVSPVDLTAACLKRIEQCNPTLNAFITGTAETATQEARRAETEIQRGDWKGP